MKFRKIIGKPIQQESGATAIITGVILSALIITSAFVVDFGIAYNESSKLQNALDSAVLAAARDLPVDYTDSAAKDAVINTALAYAQLNGVTLDASDLTLVQEYGVVTEITAQRSETVDFSFAKVMGINSGTINKIATASLETAGGLTGIVPLTITSASLNAAIENAELSDIPLKFKSTSLDLAFEDDPINGWYGVVRLDDDQAGAADYKEALINGYDGIVTVGSILDMENGAMTGPTLAGFLERFNACPHDPQCTSELYVEGCPRIITVPVIEVYDEKKKEVEVVGFAQFLLDGIGGTGNKQYITGTYIEGSLATGTPSETAENFGVYVVALTQ